MMRKQYKVMLCFVYFIGVLCISSYRNTYVTQVTKDDMVKKIMYLTFDDGPSKHTQAILDILDTYQVKATFFVTAESKEYLDLIKVEKEKGHAIGVHTYSHDYATIYQSVDAYFEDFYKMNEIIKEQTGEYATIMRFPGGSSNTISKKYSEGIMTTLAQQVQEKGYQYYDWNASNGDGNSHTSVDALVKQGVEEVKNQEISMVLMHDGGGSDETVSALPTLLEYYLKEGYEFKIIDESTPMFHHHIHN